MDFAEFSDIETVGFTTYKQKLQEQFQQEIEQEMVSAYNEQDNSFSYIGLQVSKLFPPIHLLDVMVESNRNENKKLPNNTAKNIFARVTSKFNETMDHIGKYVHVIQGKLTTAEEQLEIKQITINSLIAELDQMKEIFLAPEENNSTSDVKRLKFQLRQADIVIVRLEKKLKVCEDNYKRQSALDSNRMKAQYERKILDNKKFVDDLTRRNRQLQDKLNEKSKDDDIYHVTTATTYFADKIAKTLGLKDVITFTRNFAIIVENLWRGLVVLGYAYTLYNTTDSYIYWLKNAWRGPANKFYAFSIFPVIIFCMLKLLNF
jgi:hypothetical protein